MFKAIHSNAARSRTAEDKLSTGTVPPMVTDETSVSEGLYIFVDGSGMSLRFKYVDEAGDTQTKVVATLTNPTTP